MERERRVVEVDERDSAWEDSDPRFRVYLQSIVEPPFSASTATYDLSGFDVAEAIAWGRQAAGSDCTFAVALVVDDEHRERTDPGTGRGLVWLLGQDMNGLDSFTVTLSIGP